MKSRIFRGIQPLIVAVACIFALQHPVLLSGQTFYGSILGRVMDSTGSALPNITVTLSSPDQGFHRTATTGSDGSYTFVNLVPGNYSLVVEAPGFKRYVRDSITVDVQAVVHLDIPLEVGSVQQQIVVSSAEPLLQTENAALGGVVSEKTVQEMPLNGRNVLNLAQLIPGVVAQGGAAGNITSQNIFAGGNYQINGGTANQNAMYLDGSPMQVAYANLTALIPTQDAISEFRVQTNSDSAEYGRYSGGVINLTTKSGGNEFHGSAYEFLRNKVLNAGTFFGNQTGAGKPAFTQNQFGVNVGGPIRKDKLFFFFAYEGFRLRQGQTFVLSVPTLDELNGDFSNFRDANGNVIPIYDPQTTSCGQVNNPCTGGQSPTRQQFPGNIIPSYRFDKVADYFRQNGRLFAAPNTQGTPFTDQFNYATNASVGGNNDQINFRSDWNVSDKQRAFIRFTRWSLDELPQDPYNNMTYYFGMDPQNFVTDSIVLGDTYTFSPNMIGDLRLSYMRFNYLQGPPASITGVDMTKFGFPSYMNEIPENLRTNPVISFPDYITGQTQVINSVNNNYVLSPSLTWIHGKNTFKFGAELRREDANYFQVGAQGGNFYADNTFTSVNPFNPGETGSSIADFLLGAMSPGSGYTASNLILPIFTAANMYYQGYYVQDAIRFNDRLTAMLGIRWEIPGVWRERHDQMAVFDPTMTNPLSGTGGLDLTGGFQLVDSPGHPQRGLKQECFDCVAPRISIADRITNDTVLRGGFGLYYLPADAIFEESPFQNALNLYSNNMVTTLDNGVTPYATMDNPYPGGLIFPPGRSSDFQSILEGGNFGSQAGISPSAVLASWQPAYALNWNLAIQHQFHDGTSVDVAYAASRGIHLPINTENGINLNQLPDSYLAQARNDPSCNGAAGPDPNNCFLIKQVANPFYGVISSGALSAETVSANQLLRPFPEYQNVVAAASYIGRSDYDSLQVQVEKRMRKGSILMAAYTFSKLMTNTETSTDWLEGGVANSLGQIYQDFNNFGAEWSLGMFDTRQNLTLSYVVDLPFGRGKRYFGDVHGIADKFVSGWAADGITTFQEGYPLNLVAQPNLTYSLGGGLRPNVVPGCKKKLSGDVTKRLGEYFNTACFTVPAAFSFGNESRTDGAIRAPGIANFDFSLVKNTSITERVNLQFRTEAFNLFNRVQFGPPGTVATTAPNSTFGVIATQVNNPRLIQFGLRLNF